MTVYAKHRERTLVMTQRLRRLLLAALLLLALLGVPLARAQDGGDPVPTRDPDREQALLDRLAALNPDAVPLFAQATHALDAGRLDEARTDYEQVLVLVPDFPDALRRLSVIALRQSDNPRALALAERAYAVDASPINRATLAAALLTDETQVAIALSHAREAARDQDHDRYIVDVYLQAALIADDSTDLLSAGRMLIALAPDDPRGYYYAGFASLVQGDFEAAIPYLKNALAQGFQPAQQAEDHLARAEIGQGLARDDPAQVERAAQTLIAVAPLDATGYFYLGLAHAEQEEWREAEAALERARDLGWPDAEIDALFDADIRAEAANDRRADATVNWLILLGLVLVGWAGGLVLLLGAGSLLSRRTLATQHDPAASLGNTLYRGVIGLAALYYALSLPLLALISVGVAVDVVYGAVILDRFPAPIALVLLITASYTLWALVRSGLARASDPAPGKRLIRADAPALWALVDEVAARLHTRPVDTITLTPYTEITLTVRGGLWDMLRNRGQRHLILGLGALPGLTQGQLAALLAHHYAQWRVQEGYIARLVHTHIRQTARDLRARGVARWHNPVWVFLQVHYYVFARITRGVMRVQEAQADEVAAQSYGPEQFEAGLTHLIRQTLIFQAQLDREVRAAAAEQRNLRTLWDLPPLDDASIQALEHTLAQMVVRPASAQDHHRAPQERFARIAHITPAEPVADRPTPARELLPDLAALQAEMTRAVQARLRQRVASEDMLQD
jgi:tetratricopeptide (TPR) repeat protein